MTQSKKTKKSPAKKALLKTSRKKDVPHKKASLRSFHITANEPPFATLTFSRQTLYWAIFVISVVISQTWILHLQLELDTLLDQQQAAMQEIAR